MLYRAHLIKALHERREDFVRFDHQWRASVSDYARRWQALAGRTAREITEAVRQAKTPGALPSEEFDAVGSPVVRFGRRWRSHEEARRWALEALRERVIFAVDGSQLFSGRDLSVPLAAVQAAAFENPHREDGTYRKEARFSIITPGELLKAGEAHAADADAVVSFRRFSEETRLLGEFLERSRHWQARGWRTPVAFFDGTLLISYARPRNPIQDEYVNTIIDLVKLSRDTQVPLIGYIDQSYARDLVNLLDAMAGATGQTSLYDAQFLRVAVDGPAPLQDWGDRTSFCYCTREGLKDEFQDEKGQSLVGLVYLQTTGDGAPARLDVPAWIYDAGLLDDVIDAVRAECVVGNGYPYAIEAADAAAVITSRDRNQFLRAVQEFAANEGLSLRVSRKAASKTRRR
jgi:hypothetical protein